MNFDNFSLDPAIRSAISLQGFVTPTPIQTVGIPAVLNGDDIMGLAHTGTGKTAAFVLPMLQRLLKRPRGRVYALIIAPTRELAEQIDESIRCFGRETKLRSATVYGGVSVNNQIRKLRAGVEIVVACPGRLLDLMQQKVINLSALELLVLDEADQMFDMGFLPTIKQILRQIPAKRQTLLFSATMPAEIRSFAQSVLSSPKILEVDRSAPVATVSHAIYPVQQDHKTALLLKLLERTTAGSVLVFTRTKHRAKKLGQTLAAAGYRAASLQGNLSQNKRQEALSGFRDGKFQVLVATDIAARGIDIASVTHVINYDMPDTREAYTHRIGRTGRAARAGDALTFATPEDEEMIRLIERLLGSSIERRRLAGLEEEARPQAHTIEAAYQNNEAPRMRFRTKIEKPSAAKSLSKSGRTRQRNRRTRRSAAKV